MPKLKLTDIDFARSIQIRSTINKATVNEYAEHIQSQKPPLPPVVVFGADSRGKYYLSEGWHRVAAHRKARRECISATIREGDWKDALEHALGSNAMHGLRRTNADKRHAVELALKHWDQWSDQIIADKCGVSREFVLRVRQEVQVVIGSQPETIIGKDGKSYPKRSPTRPPPPSRPPEVPPPTTVRPIREPLQERENAPPEAPTAGHPPLPTDSRGRTIPPDLVMLWGRRFEVQDLLQTVSHVRSHLRKAQDDHDPLWTGNGQGYSPLNFSTALAQLDQAYMNIKTALPWCVCPMCQGIGCRACSGLGLMSEYRYDSIVPKEYKL